MSGWPRGAVDSTRCSVDVLAGSGLLLTCLFARYIKGEGLAEGDAGEPSEGERGQGSWKGGRRNR